MIGRSPYVELFEVAIARGAALHRLAVLTEALRPVRGAIGTIGVNAAEALAALGRASQRIDRVASRRSRAP